MKLKFYNEGWGRRIKVELNDDKNHYIDAGAQSNKYSKVSNVDTLILSHFHDDHFRSFAGFRNSDSKFYCNTKGLTVGFIRSQLRIVDNFRNFLKKVIDSQVKATECWAGDTISITYANNKTVDFIVHYPYLTDHETKKKTLSLSDKLDIAIRELISSDVNFEMCEKLAEEYAEKIIEYIDEDKEEGDNQSYNEDDGDEPNERIVKYIYFEIILKLLCLDNRNHTLICVLFEKTEIKKSAMYLNFYNISKKKLHNPHEYNLVLTTKNKSIYLPGDIAKSKVKMFKPIIDFSKVKIFEMPHHGSNKNQYWHTNYNNLNPDSIFIRCYSKYGSRKAYDLSLQGKFIAVNVSPKTIKKGNINCIGNLTSLDDYIEVDLT